MTGSEVIRGVYRAAVVGLGVSLGALAVIYFVFATQGRALDALKVVIPLFLSLGVSTLGVGLVRNETNAARVAAVGASGLTGMVLLALVSSFTLAIQRLEGGGAAAHGYLVLTNGSVGAAVGTLLGVYRVRLQQRTDQLAEEVNRLNEFAGIVAHDLRNPLHVARGYLEELDTDGSEAERARIERAHARMDRLIEHVLDLSRRGDAIGEMNRIDIESVARAAWSDIPTDGAKLCVPADGSVEADERRLRSLFENLFRNAVEHGSTSPRSQAHEGAVEHGSTGNRPEADDAVEHGASSSGQSADDADREDLTVTVGEFEDGFYVADDGRGIPPADRERVFEGGYSSDETGTGLGLAIVRQVADAHGWRVEVTESESGGARFDFSL